MSGDKFIHWRNGGLKVRTLDPRVAYGDRDGVHCINWLDAIAEQKLADTGGAIDPKLTAEIRRIGGLA